MTIIYDDDLPEQMKERQRIAHLIAEQSCIQVWNIAAKQSNDLNYLISGNETLSYLSTILMHFCARWMIMMDGIRQQDDAGVLREDLIKNVLNGILESLEIKADFEEEPPLPNGIKRLNNRRINNE